MEQATAAWVVAIAAYKSDLRSAERSKGTIRLRTYYVARFAVHVTTTDVEHSAPFGGVGIDQLTEWLANPDWRAETRKSARSSVFGFYKWAVRSGRLKASANPAADLLPVTVPRGLPRPTPDQILVDALLTANDRERLMLMLAGYAGLRRAEIAQVHPADFDWTINKVLVRGKGGRERLVPVHPDLAGEVRAELDRRSAGKTGTGWRHYVAGIDTSAYLFPGRYGHLQPDAVGKVLKRLLGGQWTGHTLRHRFATIAYRVRRDLRAVQELMGHSKPETTARYTQSDDDAKWAAVMGVAPERPPGPESRGSPPRAVYGSSYVLAA